MEQLTLIDNSQPDVFDRAVGASILAPVVTRPIAGIGNGDYLLDMPGYLGTYTHKNGRPVPLGVVSESYQLVQMRDLTDAAEKIMKETFSSEQLSQVKIRDASAKNGAWVQRQYVVEAISEELKYGNAVTSTKTVGTTVAATCSITTSFDGGSSTALNIGTLDLVCANGMTALNATDCFSKKHTKGATIDVFRTWFNALGPRFAKQVETMRHWSDTAVTWSQIEDTIHALPGMSEKKAERLLDRAEREVHDRGSNVYAITSALTYYSSHDSNEFPVRRTGHDTVATTLANRQQEVSRWTSSQVFQTLLAA